MADDVAVTAGAGTAIATQDRSSRHFQQVIDQGTDSIAAGQVTVTNTSTTIVSARANRKRVILVNRQTVPVYVEMTTATTGDFRLDPGDSLALYMAGEVDGITSAAYSASGDAKVHYVEEFDYMPLSGAERTSVAEAFLTCYGEDYHWCGRTLTFLGKKGISLLADVQNRALTWQPFIDSGLSIPAWNTELARVFNSDQQPR